MHENNEKIKKTSLTLPEAFMNNDTQKIVINNLQKIQGVNDLAVNQGEHRIDITFDSTLASEGQFLNLIEQLGHDNKN